MWWNSEQNQLAGFNAALPFGGASLSGSVSASSSTPTGQVTGVSSGIVGQGMSDPTIKVYPPMNSPSTSVIDFVIAGAGQAPESSGAAQAAKYAAKQFMKSTKQDPPLRGVPTKTPDPLKLSPLRQLMKDAVDTVGDIWAGIMSDSEIFIMAPAPVMIVDPDHMPDTPEHGPS